MKIAAKTARWFVAPAGESVTLTIDGTQYSMSIPEADRLSEMLDETALYARNKPATANR